MKHALLLMLLFSMPAFAQDDDSLVLTNVVNAAVKRLDEGSGVRAQITINLVVGPDYVTDFLISPDDVDAFKGGTVQEKLAIAKKYIRQAIRNWLQSIKPPPAQTDQGTQTVSKANITEPGDTP